MIYMIYVIRVIYKVSPHENVARICEKLYYDIASKL
jgi:hypothetical protein